MTTAISAVSSGSPSAALQAELRKTQHELSACVNCASATTSAGQTKIAALRSEVQGIEQRIEVASQAEAPKASATSTPLGNFLDVYA